MDRRKVLGLGFHYLHHLQIDKAGCVLLKKVVIDIVARRRGQRRSKALQPTDARRTKRLQVGNGLEVLDVSNTVAMLPHHCPLQLGEPFLGVEVDGMPYNRGKGVAPRFANARAGYRVCWSDEPADMKTHLLYKEKVIVLERHGDEKAVGSDERDRRRGSSLTFQVLANPHPHVRMKTRI